MRVIKLHKRMKSLLTSEEMSHIIKMRCEVTSQSGVKKVRIRTCREKAGMTQKQLADAVGVERSTVAKWESNVNMPLASKLPELAAILNVGVEDLFGTDNTGPVE